MLNTAQHLRLAIGNGWGMSALVSRNVTVAGHRTSMRLEPTMWDALSELCVRENKTVQQFLVRCLHGNHQTHFKKAVDVLQMWGMLGDKSFMDLQLLRALNWKDACAADPPFHQTLKQVERIILQDF